MPRKLWFVSWSLFELHQPALSWKEMLSTTKIELHLPSDDDMYLFF